MTMTQNVSSLPLHADLRGPAHERIAEQYRRRREEASKAALQQRHQRKTAAATTTPSFVMPRVQPQAQVVLLRVLRTGEEVENRQQQWARHADCSSSDATSLVDEPVSCRIPGSFL